MLFLGVIADVVREEKSLDPDKRKRYLSRLREMLAAQTVSTANLLRMVFSASGGLPSTSSLQTMAA